MTAVNIDARIEEADWPKRTPDKFADLIPTLKYDPNQPRGKGGRWVQSAMITVGDRQIEVVKPRRAIVAGDKLVPINVIAFDTEFQRQPGFYIGVGGKDGIGNRYERFGEYVAQHDSIEAAEVTVYEDGKIGFTNGRHRYAWLRDQGLTSIPVAMTPESVKHAKKHGYLAAVKLAWDESQHPRDKEGQFTEGGGEEPTKSSKDLKGEREAIAKVVQKVYDDWDEDPDCYAGGGICHLIAEEIAGHLAGQGIDATTVSAEIGEQHVWTVAKLTDGVYEIDVPPSTYETGAGYRWKKVKDIEFTKEDIVINRLDADPKAFKDYVEKWDESKHPRDKGGKFVLSMAVRQTLDDFGFPGSAWSVNRALREGRTDAPIERMVSTLDALMRPEPAEDLHRVVDAGLVGGLKVGDTYEEKGYTSTSRRPDDLSQFDEGGRFHTEGARQRIVVRVPKDYPRLDTDRYAPGPFLMGPAEGEVILPRGTKFQVVATKPTLIVTVVPTQKWDESQHPRDKEGKFTESGLIDRVESVGTKLAGMFSGAKAAPVVVAVPSKLPGDIVHFFGAYSPFLDDGKASVRGGLIYVNPRMADPEWVKAQVQSKHQLQLVSESIEATVAHEYGHHLTNQLILLHPKAAQEMVDYASAPIEKKGWFRKKTQERWQTDDLDGKSKYATTTVQEWLAEAFTDGYLNGDKASASGKFIYGMMRRAFGTVKKFDPDQPRDAQGQWTKAAIRSGQAHTVSEDEFLRYHYTGHIPSDAYERYEAGDLDFIHRKDFETLLDTREVNGQTVEIRLQTEPIRYGKRTVAAPKAEQDRLHAEYVQEAKRLGTSPMMASLDLGRDSEAYKSLQEFENRWRASESEYVRDAHGNLVYLTPEEVQAKGLPAVNYTVGAFVGGKAIGYAGDEFGASGVYLARAYQRHGLGLTLFKTYLEKSGRLAKGQQIGQMTHVGQELVRALHRQLVREATQKWDRNQPRDAKGRWSEQGSISEREGKPIPESFEHPLYGFQKIVTPVDKFEYELDIRMERISSNTTWDYLETAKGKSTFSMHDIARGGDKPFVELHWVLATKRGAGREAFQRITRLADKHNIKLGLWAQPLPGIGENEGFMLSKPRLERLYREFGFKVVRHEGRGKERTAWMEREPQKAKKADPATGRYVTPFVSFEKQGDESLRMIASLNSSRLATWGFTAEAEVRGMARYKLTAVLDGRTSDFCRIVDGKIFHVEDARRKVIEVLNVQNPEDLKVVQPWPKQTKAALQEFQKMTPQQLTDRGLHIPPYHPHCRTICRVIGSSKDEEMEDVATIPDDTEVFQAVTQADLREIGVDATPEEVAEWNAHVGMSPVELMSKLTGMPPQEVMTKGVGSKPVQFEESGNIAFHARGEIESGVAFKLGAILDPFTGIYYLTQADLLAGTPAAEVKFLKNMFSALIEMGIKSTATSVAVGVAGNAAYYAKLGFLPDELEWDVLRSYAWTELETGALKPLLDSLKVEDRLLVRHLLQDQSTSALSALVDLPFTYQGRTIGEWILAETAGTWGLDLLDEVLVAQARAYLS